MKFSRLGLIGLSVLVLGACGGSSKDKEADKNVVNCTAENKEENIRAFAEVKYNDKKIVEKIQLRSESANIEISEDSAIDEFEKALIEQFAAFDGAVEVELKQDKSKKIGIVILNIDATKVYGKKVTNSFTIVKELDAQVTQLEIGGYVCNEVKYH